MNLSKLNALLNYSVRVGKLFNIPIFLHISLLFFLLPVVRSSQYLGVGYSVEYVVLVVLSILLHELGHGLAAKHYGLKGLTIMLHGFGGFATSSGYRSAKQSLVICLAGPAVTFVIAAIGIGFGRLSLSEAPMEQAVRMQLFLLAEVGYLSLLLGFLNLIPSLPFDGGQALAALIQFKIPEFKARRLVAHLGLVICIPLMIYGFASDRTLITLFGAIGAASSYSHLANTGGIKFGEFFADRKHRKDLAAVKIREEERTQIYLDDVRARLKEREEKERLRQLLGMSKDDN